jgi:hypothetical protein
MKHIAIFLAYIAIMANLSYYFQLQAMGVNLSGWITIAYIFTPLILAAILSLIVILITAVGMHYKWWTKPDTI